MFCIEYVVAGQSRTMRFFDVHQAAAVLYWLRQYEAQGLIRDVNCRSGKRVNDEPEW